MKLMIDVPEELYETYKGRSPSLGDKGMDMIAQSIANGTPPPKGREWITVSERLPEEQGLYLVTVKSGDKYCVSTDIYNSLYKKGFKMLNAIAWMPLPEPFKAESEN